MNDPRIQNPRGEIHELIAEGNLTELMIRAGALHNHFCPGLSMGVMASAAVLKQIGSEPVIAIVNTASCLVDGVQYLTGATVGNRGLIIENTGESIVAIVKKSSGEGFRVTVTEEFSKRSAKHAPGFAELRAKMGTPESQSPEFMKEFRSKAVAAGFGMLSEPLEEVLSIEPVTIEIPESAR